MNQRTAEAMAEKVAKEVGRRSKVRTDEMPAHGFKWVNLKARHDL